MTYKSLRKGKENTKMRLGDIRKKDKKRDPYKRVYEVVSFQLANICY